MRLYRVYPWRRAARRGELGHALYRPPRQGSSRIDNPEHFLVLYASTSASTAIAESLAYKPPPWDAKTLFRSDGLRYHVATFELPAESRLCDLDEPQSLLERKLKPSTVISRQRATTQAWALRIFQERRWSGISWWSFYDPAHAAAGLWTIDGAQVLATRELRTTDPAFAEAADLLNRPVLS